ncbi:ABC transporter ATP-binding protein [Desulfovibrio legallii]|uniref:ABC transporter ATP-binding protein n=1 Tax=Desulfovibrio legallii TaxID=571438 RepID=UPI001F2853B7|nr:ATP-binding cassette domain-containing protein [Desulfovibrio legallii]
MCPCACCPEAAAPAQPLAPTAAPAADPVFRLRRVRKTRPGDAGFCLRIDRLDVPRGSLLALVGPSGCGKSTALDLLACALRPDAPASAPSKTEQAAPEKTAFTFAPTPDTHTDVLAAWEHGGTDALARLRLRHLGYVLQTGGLLPFLTAQENILLRCRALGLTPARPTAVPHVLGKASATAPAKDLGGAADEVAARLGITKLLHQYPATLSVGERQRVAIAAALAHSPAVVLADEPTAALDPLHADAVLRLLAQLTREGGITVIMVTHNRQAAQDAGFTPVPVRLTATGDATLARIAWPDAEEPDATTPDQSRPPHRADKEVRS